MGGSIDDIRQVAAEEVDEREQLGRVVDIEADGLPDPLSELRREGDDDQPEWRHNA